MQATTPTLFEEHQQFRQPWIWVMLSQGLVWMLIVLVVVIVQAPDQLPAILGIAGGIAVVIGVAVLLYTLQLSVRLDAEGLHVRFFPFVNRHIPLMEIVRWEARTYRPVLEYGGWGIRWGWKGMAYNVGGNRGGPTGAGQWQTCPDRVTKGGRADQGDRRGEGAGASSRLIPCGE